MKKTIILTLTAVIFQMTAALAQEEFKPSVDFKGSRFSAGYLDSGKNGSFSDGSFQTPDVKLRVNWQMSPDVTVVTRMSLSNATFGGLDYFYMDYKNFFALMAPSLKSDESKFNPSLRIGRLKVDIGEETWADNPVESVVISNSSAAVKGYDEGMQIYDDLSLGIPVKWSLSLTNGNSGTGADNEQAKALCLKIAANPLKDLYMSVSRYGSGDLGSGKAEISYAGLADAPAKSEKWQRSIFEFDLRYDFGAGKESRLNPGAPAWSDSKAFIRLAYGLFDDDGDASGAVVTDRKGSYAFIEGCYNVTGSIYLGTRYSFTDFEDSDVYASLNGATANSQTRVSIGAGFRLTNNTHLKFEYMLNGEKVGSGTDEPENDQMGFLFTTKF
ncbi:MAG: hypothetical protein HZA48_06715 [Planctomycetes bacterium]|nr:hypothetical protein [Planctomycetota bacterium]